MRDYDIESDLKQEKFQSIKLVQGDRGNKIKINVYEDGQPVSLTGCSISAKYKRADGEVVYGTVENKTDNYFYAVMDNNITKVAGTLKMIFTIEKDDVKVSTFMLLADVREGIGENTGSSGGSTGGGEVTVDLNDYQKKMDNGLETKNKYIVGAINEVNSQCKDIAKQIESGNIGNNVEPMYGDIPKMFITGDDWSKMTTAKNEVGLSFEIISKTNKFKGGIKTKYQGNSSLSKPKHNLTCKLYKDTTFAEKLKIDFKGWGKQSKFVAKANWIDHSHARNNVSALLWGDCVRSRADFENYPELYKTSPNVGAIDGFPIKLYANGIYQGLYTLNIPKDKWMANMDDSLDNHCILCGENYGSGCFRALANINGTDWSDEIHDVVPVSIKTRWNETISFVMNSTDVDFKENLHNYFYVDGLIDYIIFGLVSCGLDAFGKNQLYLTYDGEKFIAGLYDGDSTWGLYWNGESFVATDYSREQFEDYKNTNNQGNLLYVRLLKLFINEIKARYKELRQGALSSTNIINRFERFTDVINSDLYKEDYASTTGEGKFTGIPSKDTNNIQQIRNYAVERLAYCDSYINSLVEPIPCTNITLNQSTLTFTSTNTQTLTSTVTPTDTTDNVVWSVNPIGICTVENGVVTPVSNGNCIITATCGSQTTTCNIVVNLPNVAVTSLSLDKNTLNCFLNENLNNMLTGIESSTVGSLLVFNNITLESGIYLIKNINGGSFTWLGYTIDGSRKEPNGNTTSQVIFQVLESKSVSISGNPNGNTPDKLALYKLSLQNLQSFIKEGYGYFNNDGNIISNNTNIYSKTLNLDSSKTYGVFLKNTVQTSFNGNYICMLADGICTKGTGTVIANSLIATFRNISKLAISINYSMTSTSLDDIIIYELVPETQQNTTLTATITPANATNKNVGWTVNNENVELVADGLNCTIKAKTVGSSVVTCTSFDTTNGTISDTCSITVS